MISTETEKTTHSAAEQQRLYRAVGMQIRAARDKRGFTQEAVATTVGLSRTSLTNIEKGRQKLLLHTFLAIASALESPISDLLPNRSAILDSISEKLPASLPPEQKDFIARAINHSTPNEPPQIPNDTPKGQRVTSRKQHYRSPSRR